MHGDQMYNHAPTDYHCPLCALVGGLPDPLNSLDDVVLRDEHVLAFVSPAWWPNNPGHLLVIPTGHFENLYDLPVEMGGLVHAAIRTVALALKGTYGCDGISTRQHNEPAGNQDVWHYHVHVFPRYAGDALYLSQRRWTTPEERRPFAERLRAYLAAQDA
jgi:histidine triad (HIT) family protein